MNGPGWEMQQACEERERVAIEALNHCAAAGVDEESLRILARECGVDPKYIQIGAQRAKN
jgi:hypothetical protein